MDVNIYPFSISLEIQNDLPLNSAGFIDYIKNQNKTALEVFHKDRILTIQEIPDSNYISGILLSFRDYEAHCKITRCENGGYSASIEKIKDGAEYNFFVLNKITLKGVWLTYFNSASISVLDKILRIYFDKYANLNGIETSMKFKYKNKARASLILSRETLEEALGRFNKINYVEYTERNKESSFFSPDTINFSKRRIFLKKGNNLVQTVNEIIALHSSEESENTSINGQNTNGKKETLNLDNIFRPWTTYDYDTVTASLENFNTNNINSHQMTNTLIQCISDNPKHRQIIEAA